ncbi:MAG: tetratricopeptide repeat protein [Rhodospirillaceae bacterium]|nr:tetratricopeptide repeat protein [Rhodospirillales bacterium]
MARALATAILGLALTGIGPAEARKDELGPLGQVPGPTHCGVSGGNAATAAASTPPLFNGLGTRSFVITTANPEAQAYFDQGLRWAYAFNHAEARRAFVEAQRRDSGCALCAWGEALVLGPNINKPMDPADNSAALAALHRAEGLAGQASAKEQALIQAAKLRYSADHSAERAALDAAYGEAMSQVAQRFPEDSDIQVLAAEALMDTQPWDYWQDDRRSPKGRHGETLALLERVLATEPDHPGAIHLYIHAVEASDDPQRALAPARRLAALMPTAGHIVHMPSHIYYRVGLWKESLEANRQAVRADEAYFATAGAAPGIYRDGYYPHNIHFLLVTAQMSGDGATAIAAADKLAATITEEGARAIAWAQPIKAAPYFTHAQFSPPETVLGLPDPGDGLPYVKALWHYARGTALAQQGSIPDVEGEIAAIRRLAEQPAIARLGAEGVPAPDVLALAVEVLRGRAAQSTGQLDRAAAHFREAIAVEDKLTYTEPPWWYYPVRQSLGATLMMAGDPAGAEAVFREALAKVPNNGWALWGLAQAQRAQGNHKAAAESEATFQRVWVSAISTPQLAGL